MDEEVLGRLSLQHARHQPGPTRTSAAAVSNCRGRVPGVEREWGLKWSGG